jgi:hypothetical protein
MITGGCLCGAVRFSVAEAPITARTCWCRLCQYIGAGNATVNAIFRAEAVSVTGETADFASTADSGAPMHRRFCPKCGTHLFSAAETRPELMVVRVGALDDPEIGRPRSVIWTDSAPSWARLDPELPTVAGQPPPVG